MEDLKYLSALTIPLSALLGFTLLGYWSFTTPIYAFVFIPILEILLPQDTQNLSQAAREKKSAHWIFDGMLYLNLPIVYGLLTYALYLVSSRELAPIEWAGTVFSLGIVLGTNGINVGHELGHRKALFERIIGKALLLPALYMHFFVEHNYGHHVHAATPEDPATARFREPVYVFWVRSVGQQYLNSWRIQRKLKQKQGFNWYSFKNDMFWFTVIQSVFLGLVFISFGVRGLILAVASAVVGFLLLETVNYIEHYGLLRKKKSSGRYERVKEIHSWNSNHIIGRIVLYELTRHSDHHFISAKKYQLLDCHPTSPQMPYGYPTSMVIALVPPLWFSIMNHRIPPQMVPRKYRGVPAA